eukprot:scaffold22278_cov49-Cylindrotheca_fusiformis.AAC.1
MSPQHEPYDPAYLHPSRPEAYPDWESVITTIYEEESCRTHPLPLLLPMADHPPSDYGRVPLHHPRIGMT